MRPACKTEVYALYVCKKIKLQELLVWEILGDFSFLVSNNILQKQTVDV